MSGRHVGTSLLLNLCDVNEVEREREREGGGEGGKVGISATPLHIP